jgi:hypothetical protein
MVPTTGAGPLASLMGNALEKGYGLTPYEDHFAAVLQLQAVLADGSLYQSKLHQLGGTVSDRIFKWKIGPYLDGLFAQGNVGIVTEMTIALARRPDHISQFFIFIDDKDLETAVKTTAKVKERLGSFLSGVNLLNARRVMSMNQVEKWPVDGPMPESQLKALAKENQITDWMVVGCIYTPKEFTKGASRIIRKEFSAISQRTVFLTEFRLKVLKQLVKILPIQFLRSFVETSEKAVQILRGIPNELALPLTHLKNPKRPQVLANINPTRDRCGLIWFAPLLPIDPTVVRTYVKEIERICLSHDIDPLITLTTLSERCYDSTVPILFNLENEAAVRKGRQCFDDLIKMAQGLGIFPYRMDVERMSAFFQGSHDPAQRMIDQIKQALDPHQILSPGRYSSIKSEK